MKRISLLLLFISLTISLFAQDDWERKWGVEATLGGGSFYENKTLVNEDSYNAFEVTADYYITPRLALSAGLYLEQDGIMTDYSNGIGMKSFCMFGPEVGGKFYFFPKKWMVQPYVGAMLKTNVLNLGKEKGKFGYEGNTVDCTKAVVDYDIQCPVASVAPKLGIDLRLTKSVILTANMDYRIGLYGHNRSHTEVLEGYHAGNAYDIDESMVRNGYSIGLKIDLPWRKKDNGKVLKGLLDVIYFWISSKAY